MGARVSKKKSRALEIDETAAILASETPFTVSEVESLRGLYRKLSCSIVDDGLIQKEELQFALFRTTSRQNLFVGRIFNMFDEKRTGHIDFEEFVRALSIFHPKTPEAQKVAYAFKLYDLRRTGFIEREELKQMVLALLNESELSLSEDMVENIVEQTFKQVDTDGDGKINQEEWKDYASKNPLLLRNMTLPYLMDITLGFPSFVMHKEGEGSEVPPKKLNK